MRRIAKVLILILILTAFQQEGKAQVTTGDSLRYLTGQDTVFLQYHRGKLKFIKHRLSRGQTLYSMARFYGLRLSDIYYYNDHLVGVSIKIGETILIPIPNKAIRRFKTEEFDEDEYATLSYLVKRGDTMYNLANRVFKMPIGYVMATNNLETHTLKKGQRLDLGWVNITGIPDSLQSNNRKKNREFWEDRQLRSNFTKVGKTKAKPKLVVDRGKAYWAKDDKNLYNFTGNYAFHKTAAVGSTLKVTNPMSRRTVYLKVISKLNHSAQIGEDVVVLLPPKIAKRLGARDAYFYVEVSRYE